jgi:hypothetical protein
LQTKNSGQLYGKRPASGSLSLLAPDFSAALRATRLNEELGLRGKLASCGIHGRLQELLRARIRLVVIAALRRDGRIEKLSTVLQCDSRRRDKVWRCKS